MRVRLTIRDKAKVKITVIGISLMNSPKVPDTRAIGMKARMVVTVPDISASPTVLIA